MNQTKLLGVSPLIRLRLVGRVFLLASALALFPDPRTTLYLWLDGIPWPRLGSIVSPTCSWRQLSSACYPSFCPSFSCAFYCPSFCLAFFSAELLPLALLPRGISCSKQLKRTLLLAELQCNKRILFFEKAQEDGRRGQWQHRWGERLWRGKSRQWRRTRWRWNTHTSLSKKADKASLHHAAQQWIPFLPWLVSYLGLPL